MLSFDRFYELQIDERRDPNWYLPRFQSSVLQFCVFCLHDYKLKMVMKEDDWPINSQGPWLANGDCRSLKGEEALKGQV